MTPLTSVQENYRKYQESQRMRDLAQERITASGERIPELKKIDLDSIVHCAETYTWGVFLDSGYKPLSEALPELDGTRLGEINTTSPITLETSYLPGTRKTLLYCLGKEGLEKHSFNSVWHDNYRMTNINRNPIIGQVGSIAGGSLLMGTLVSLLGLGNLDVMPYLFSVGCLGIAGQLVLPCTKGDRNEMREDKTAWKLYGDHIKRSE